MARHYSTKHCFRQMPASLLARFFAARNLLTDFDFSALMDGKPEALFETWLALPEEQRRPADVELQDIFEMSCEKGFRAILDEVRWQWHGDPGTLTAFVERLSDLPNHYHRAMVTFLDHPGCWKGATLFFHADSLSYWRKRKHLGHWPAAVDERSLRQLATQIGGYFHHTEGRGRHCVVEPFRRGELDYFFVYGEDYSQQSVEWVDGEFGRRPHNPAFEVVFVYSQREGTLDLNFRGAYTAVEPLQGIFATVVLGMDELPPDPKDPRVYDLDPLRARDFEFVYAPGSGIEGVWVKKLRFSSGIRKGDRITLEADVQRNPQALYNLIEQVARSVRLSLYRVTQVELGVSLRLEADKPAKSATIRLTYPNSCSLKYDERDLKLRDMLAASGIELQEPVDSSAAVAP